jgi:hypothetical protein
MKPMPLFAWALFAGCFLCNGAAQAIVPVQGGGRPPGPAPVGWAYRWVPPTYRNIVDRVWIAERRDLVQDWVQVSPSRWEQVWREVVIPGHWDTTVRQVLVTPGRWELVRIDAPPPRPIPLPPPVVILPTNPPTVGVEGYKNEPGEDLSKFSPLREWPDKK